MRRFKKRTGSRIKKERRSGGIIKRPSKDAFFPGTMESKTLKQEKEIITPVKPKGKGGRKSKYTEDFPLLVQGFAREGLNDKEIALKLGINVATLYEYQKEYPEFSKAIKEGKAPVDIQVENAMLKRCLGFQTEEVSVEYDPVKKEGDEAIVTKVIKKTKEIIPHFGSAAFWLTNRKPETWQNRQNVDATITPKPMAMKDLLASEEASQ